MCAAATCPPNTTWTPTNPCCPDNQVVNGQCSRRRPARRTRRGRRPIRAAPTIRSSTVNVSRRRPARRTRRGRRPIRAAPTIRSSTVNVLAAVDLPAEHDVDADQSVLPNNQVVNGQCGPPPSTCPPNTMRRRSTQSVLPQQSGRQRSMWAAADRPAAPNTTPTLDQSVLPQQSGRQRSMWPPPSTCPPNTTPTSNNWRVLGAQQSGRQPLLQRQADLQPSSKAYDAGPAARAVQAWSATSARTPADLQPYTRADRRDTARPVRCQSGCAARQSSRCNRMASAPARRATRR